MVQTESLRHVIWDWNGTLLDDAWLCVEILNLLLEEHGREPLSYDSYRDLFDFPVIEFYRKIGFETDLDFFQSISHQFINSYQSRMEACQLQQGALEAICQLLDSDISNSILSAAYQKNLDHAVERYGLSHLLHGWIGIDDIFATGKVERGLQWIESQAWRREEMLLIGDTLHDYEVAKALGVPCILVDHGHHSRNRLESCGVPVISGITDLFPYLEKSGGNGTEASGATGS